MPHGDLVRPQPRRPMEADPALALSPIARRHGHVDESGIALTQLPQLGGIPMRQHRPWPTRKHRRQPTPLQPEPIMAHGVNTAVKAVKPAAPNPVSRSLGSPFQAPPTERELRRPTAATRVPPDRVGRFPFPSRNRKRHTQEIRPLHRCCKRPKQRTPVRLAAHDVRAALQTRHGARHADSYGSDQLVRAGRRGARADRGASADHQRLHPHRCRGCHGRGRRDQRRRSAPVRRRSHRGQGHRPRGRDAVHDGIRRLRRLRARARRLPGPAACGTRAL